MFKKTPLPYVKGGVHHLFYLEPDYPFQFLALFVTSLERWPAITLPYLAGGDMRQNSRI
jgi:hypothetical protein